MAVGDTYRNHRGLWFMEAENNNGELRYIYAGAPVCRGINIYTEKISHTLAKIEQNVPTVKAWDVYRSEGWDGFEKWLHDALKKFEDDYDKSIEDADLSSLAIKKRP